ncbi:MAG: hypothetical protein QGG36_15075 [Pirellulaceae bacterium]|jgi:hypothetical protein|nr:hypothetical protein [Pirellulaceae bacterium]
MARFTDVMKEAMANSAAQQGQVPPPEQMMLFMTVMYGALGAVAMLVGAVHVFAGLQNYRFRRRVFGTVALGMGMLSVFTCYCAPTGIALAIYGMIVYLNGPVVSAFDMAKQGYSGDAVLATFNRYRYEESKQD